MKHRISADEHDRLVTDVLRFLHRRRVRAEDFGLCVKGSRQLVPALRGGFRPSPDMEIRIRVVMEDWEAYGGGAADPLDSNALWRKQHGFASKAEGIRYLSGTGLANKDIARRLRLAPKHVSTVLARPELAPATVRRAAA